MAEHQTQAVSSPAEATDPFNGENLSFDEYSRYRKENEIPARFKTTEQAEAEAADAPEETADSEAEVEEAEAEIEGEPEPPKETQGPKGKGAEQRIKQLVAEKKHLQAELEEVRRPKQAQAAPPPATPQNYQEWRKDFKPSQWIEDYAKANPDATYEDANAAMADRLGEVREHFSASERARTEAMQRIEKAKSEAMEVYPDFLEIAEPMADKVVAIIHNPQADATLKRALLDPEGHHILYALGSEPELAAKFEKLALSDPAEAIYLWKSLKAEVRKELEVTPTKETPAKQQTSAPKPPSSVKGSSSRTFDVSDESLSPEEWMRKRTADLNTRKKG